MSAGNACCTEGCGAEHGGASRGLVGLLRRVHVLAEVLWDALVQGQAGGEADAVGTGCMGAPVCAGCFRVIEVVRRGSPTGRD